MSHEFKAVDLHKCHDLQHQESPERPLPDSSQASTLITGTYRLQLISCPLQVKYYYILLVCSVMVLYWCSVLFSRSQPSPEGQDPDPIITREDPAAQVREDTARD